MTGLVFTFNLSSKVAWTYVIFNGLHGAQVTMVLRNACIIELLCCVGRASSSAVK